jgi:hypothetical protein
MRWRGPAEIYQSLLKLRCNKPSAYIERRTPALVEEEAPFLKHVHVLRVNTNLVHRSWWDLKPKMTVLARASSNLTDRPIMNKLGCRWSGRGVIYVLSRHLPVGNKENHERPQPVGVFAHIRTGHLPDTSQKRCPLGQLAWWECSVLNFSSPPPYVCTNTQLNFSSDNESSRRSEATKCRPAKLSSAVDCYILIPRTLKMEVFNSYIFWDITPCNPLKVNWRFGGTCRLHLHGRNISQPRNQLCLLLVSCLAYSSTLTMEATCFSES